MRTTTLVLMLAMSSSACYQYFPVEEAAPLPEPGTEVRAQLAAPQPLELGTVTIHDVSRIEGDVYESEGDTLALFSRRIFSAYGFDQFTNGAVFYFDRSQFGRLERRKFLPLQTGIAAGAITAGVLATMYFVLDLGGGAEGPNTKPDPQVARAAGVAFSWIVPY